MSKMKRLKEEVAEMIESGLTNKEIAKALNVDYSFAVELIRVVEQQMFEVDMEYKYPYGDYEHIPDTQFAYITLMRK